MIARLLLAGGLLTVGLWVVASANVNRISHAIVYPELERTSVYDPDAAAMLATGFGSALIAGGIVTLAARQSHQ